MKRRVTVDASCLECGATDKPHKARGLCEDCYKRHYMRKFMKKKREKQTTGEWEKSKERVVRAGEPCTKCGNKSHHAKGLCARCYKLEHYHKNK